MKRPNLLSPLTLYTLSIVALLIFLYGFFPLQNKRSTVKFQSSDANQSRLVDKLAIIVIDALRYDFVEPQDSIVYMPFTWSKVQNKEACYIVTRAHSPTVTLPRLKAITSGFISSYTDVVLNFMSSALEEENFIKEAVNKGLKVVFYGDETWLKLFPDSFVRSEGTNSFFTNDYVEVDNNVTRHIEDEFANNDWDIIILHYLGLDHIGHTEGPNSPKIKSKLLEMDDIVKRFYDHFEQLKKLKGLKTMLIVTGDHGMKDSGGHGGVTFPEVSVPLISLGNPCTVLSGWADDQTPLQIDLTSTLSILFGLSIPANNMGKVMPCLFPFLTRKEIIRSLELNRLQLRNLKPGEGINEEILKREFENWLSANSTNEKVERELVEKYFQILNQISQELVSTNSGFKLPFLFLGIFFLWLFVILLLRDFVKTCPKPGTLMNYFLIFATALHGVSLFSSSFIEEEHQTWYFMWATLCIFTLIQTYSKAMSFNGVLNFVWWIIVSIMHRILRRLNQTGDKWASLPDIKFYLHGDGKQHLLFLVFLLGMMLILFCAFSEKCSAFQIASYGISILAVISYRIETDYFKNQYLNLYCPFRGFIVVIVFWVFLCIFFIQTWYYRTPFYLVWIMYNSFLQRPHNVLLLPIQVFVSKRLNNLFYKPQDLVWNSFAHVWLGNVFYFYQGNGNSLSNVDVAAGFVGIHSYNPLYAGLMITSQTFNAQILSYILSPKCNMVFALMRLIPVTIYCTVVIFQLHHLFIWSVFSPKLLFESSMTVVLLLPLISNSLLKFFKLPFG